MHPVYFVALFWVLAMAFGWVMKFRRDRREKKREEARRPRIVKIKIVHFTCRMCSEPIEDGELAVRRFNVVEGTYFSHVKCTPPDALERAVDAP